ncbi:MAG: peptide-methionine (S)-S-oxide reductase [Planctomycetota bacterium]
MGYAGGESSDPTYHNLGGHTETLQVDFDPTKLAYSEVLALFWNGHNPHAAARSSQYMSALFWHNAEQRRLAEDVAAQTSADNGGAQVTTKLLEFKSFHLAEDYHQKYTLRRHRDFENALLEVYPDYVDFTNSTAAARLNGYLAGNGSSEDLLHDLPLLGLSAQRQEQIRAMLRR